MAAGIVTYLAGDRQSLERIALDKREYATYQTTRAQYIVSRGDGPGPHSGGGGMSPQIVSAKPLRLESICAGAKRAMLPAAMICGNSRVWSISFSRS